MPVSENNTFPPSKFEQSSQEVLLSLTARIVSAHLSSVAMPTEDVTGFIDTIHAKLKAISFSDKTETQQEPALPIDQSITPDFIYCLEDGKGFRMLKKHLRSCYNMSPEEYRAKWGLDSDYPMVAPNYAVKRQELAKQSGLGKKRN